MKYGFRYVFASLRMVQVNLLSPKTQLLKTIAGLTLGLGLFVGVVMAEAGIYGWMPYGFGSASSYGFVHSPAAYGGAYTINQYMPSLIPILAGGGWSRLFGGTGQYNTPSYLWANQAIANFDRKYGWLFGF